MNKYCFRPAIVMLLLAATQSGVGDEDSTRTVDALRKYVHQPDPAYSWQVVKKVEGDRVTTLVVRLTSQSWLTKADVDRPVWMHWLVIVRPHQPAHNKSFLLIGGGSNDGEPPERPSQVTSRIAQATNSVVAELRMVPNQPLTFHGDGVRRKEDDLIGYAWAQFLDTGNVHWLPRLPMVKSVVRAMDCIQELMASKEGGELEIQEFVVAGGSKRGWTTWMTGAADKRVAAIVPIVIDVVHTDRSMRHHAAVYGFWADAIGDYVRHGITKRWGDPRMPRLYEAVDPYYHLDRLRMPKFIVNACGDQFFCPDSSQFYFDKLQGEKMLRYVPNADHSLDGSDAVESIAAFYQTLLTGQSRPKLDWTFESDGSLRVTTKDRPTRVLLWQATNPKARDFRLKTIGAAFVSRELQEEGGGKYVGRIEPPEQGWAAFLIELTFDTGTPLPLKLTTAVRILPDKLPYAGIDPDTTPYESEAAGSR
ncbi:MAG: PhoPQ-activated pathogenicity-related family protein [Planctomycetes bacterium]|nr:PhoPQ-activated pathogenicity-related family protein [Planctomycetota bacterium]